MANFTDAFRPESGINLDDLVGVFAGTGDPSVGGEAAPVGSLYIQANGANSLLWQKFDVADTDWRPFNTYKVKVSGTDTSAEFLDVSLLVSSNLTKTITSPGFNESLQLDLSDTAVAPGSYTRANITVDQKGRITAASNGLVTPGPGADYLLYMSDSATSGDPGNGKLGWSNFTNLLLSTSLRFDYVDDSENPGGVDISAYLALVKPGAVIYIQHRNDASIYQRWAVTSSTDSTGYFTYGVTLLDSGGGFTTVSNNHDLAATINLVDGSGGGGTVTSVAATGSTGLTIGGSPIISAGTLTFTLDADLQSISQIATIGIAARSATNTWLTRTIQGTAGNIAVTNGAGTSGDPTINLVSTGISAGTYTKITLDAFGRATAGTSPSTLAGLGITDAQPLDAFLTSISNVGGAGVMIKDGDTAVIRAIVAGSSKISITNGDGIAGDPTIDLGTVTLDDLSNVIAPSASVGDTLYFNGTNWVNSDRRLKLYSENPVTPSTPAAIGTNSVAIGTESQADAENSVAIGAQSLARFPGITQANGRFASQGDAQTSKYLVRSHSVNASQTELFLDGTGGTQQLIPPSDSTWFFEATITGHRTDAADGHAGYKLKGVAYREGALNTVLLGRPSKEILTETNAAWDVFVEVDMGTNALVFKVIGETGKTIRWLALIETVEVTN